MSDLSEEHKKLIESIDPSVIRKITELAVYGTGSSKIKGNALLTVLVAASRHKRDVDGKDFTQEEIDKLEKVVARFLATALLLSGITECGGVFRVDEESGEAFVDTRNMSKAEEEEE